MSLRFEMLDDSGKPVVVYGSRLVVYDEFGNPISIAVSHGPRTTVVATAEDPMFLEILNRLGISRTLVIDSVSGDNLRR